MKPLQHDATLFFRSRALAAGTLTVFYLLSGVTGGHAQQAQSPPAPGKPIPTFEALPHSPMPHGEFQQWCGLNDVALVRAELLEAFADGVKVSTLLAPRKTQAQCSDDGKRMAVVDDDAGWITEVDVRSAAVIRKLATFEQNRHTKMSFSPNLKSVVADRPLTLASGVSDLKVIETDGRARDARWHPDSSEFFVVSEAKEIVVEVYDVQQKTGGGNVPAAYLYRDGWFANSHALYLYLGLAHDEFGPGVIWQCQIENWKCRQIASNVSEASAGGDGVLGIVRPVSEHANTGIFENYPLGYAAEIRDGNGQVVVRQQFKLSAWDHLKLAVSPSGKKAILSWHVDRGPECRPGSPDYHPCMDGTIVDLSGRPNALAQEKTEPAQAISPAPLSFAGWKQIALTEKNIQGMLAAGRAMKTITDSVPEDIDKLTSKTTARLDVVARKNGLASYQEYKDVVENVSLVLGGLDFVTRKYVGKEASIREQMARIKADKKMSADARKEALQDLSDGLQLPLPIVENKGNVTLVLKYYDKIMLTLSK